ncbi:protein kinase-like protein [Herbihabitans rhizosphaerae]|uniref:non-specific serine/threonine protein kinase n=1 Tax=Herbihabitans rhizosphaerae TaxID=1872711 RepID=A0A4Q7KLC6_9PSEU|nr:serine/threonine-protein kinase [Herbihabitans rhizosphaerae]RZS34746.1 protein kinase-like protein [Herbihabitans rhizosphaerae]
MDDPRVIADRYEIVSELGRGGMGIVWLAEDRTIGRRVAIKELHVPPGVPPAERGVFEERVLREARTAGRLNDPAVVTVYDVLRTDGGMFIVMELVEAPTLDDEIKVEGPLPPSQVAAIGEQVLSALEAAHAAGVVHRDVKPSNVMLPSSHRAKLTDFGIAQAHDDPRITTSGILVGSPTYIAPERLHGEDAGPASDLWALGAVLYFAVEGRSPFERTSTAATMNAILNDTPVLTRAHGPLAEAIMGLLERDPRSRPTPDRVRALLSTVDSPVHQTGGTPVMTGPVPVRRKGNLVVWVTAAAVPLVAFLVTLVVVLTDGDKDASQSGPPPESAGVTTGAAKPTSAGRTSSAPTTSSGQSGEYDGDKRKFFAADPDMAVFAGDLQNRASGCRDARTGVVAMLDLKSAVRCQLKFSGETYAVSFVSGRDPSVCAQMRNYFPAGGATLAGSGTWSGGGRTGTWADFTLPPEMSGGVTSTTYWTSGDSVCALAEPESRKAMPIGELHDAWERHIRPR